MTTTTRYETTVGAWIAAGRPCSARWSLALETVSCALIARARQVPAALAMGYLDRARIAHECAAQARAYSYSQEG